MDIPVATLNLILQFRDYKLEIPQRVKLPFISSKTMAGVFQVANSSFFESAVCRGRRKKERKNLIHSAPTLFFEPQNGKGCEPSTDNTRGV